MYAKRGSAVLYVPKRNQHIIKSSIPTTHQYIPPDSPRYNAVGTNFVSQHDWLGAWDQTPFATIPAAIAFREWLGGENAINDYCHQLALDGSKKLVKVLGTRDIDISGEVTLNMPNVQLPLPVESTPGEVYTPELVGKINAALQGKLLLEWKTYAAHCFHNGAWWCRCSAQVFNEVSDFEYLGKALNAICTEIKGTLLTQGQKVEI